MSTKIIVVVLAVWIVVLGVALATPFVTNKTAFSYGIARAADLDPKPEPKPNNRQKLAAELATAAMASGEYQSWTAATLAVYCQDLADAIYP